MRKIKSVLVANRGEIAIRVFRACNEMGIKTVAIYSKEDTLSLHRNQADEAYLVGEGKKPVDAYLDIEDIIRIAKEHDIDAIHPGYGFLSENEGFARRCEEEGIIFIGPKIKHLNMFGDKVNAREQAKLAKIPMIPGSDGALKDYAQLEEFADTHGFPLMIKAVNGGGGRGMREVHHKEDLRDAYDRAKSEAKAAFGDDDVYVEKLIVEPKHIEVQILGDEHGNVVHLHERDCSVQRRHQKVVEMAPAFALSLETRKAVCDAAVKIMKNVGYVNAGTVEFLVTADGSFYFIEVNPRIQVEHTVTEMITDIDIVHAQIRIAEGFSLHSPEVGIPEQDKIPCKGTAIQCRITTEDPKNNFMPDTGKILAYRSSGGFGIRLDSGNAFTGAVVTPYYDSLLVKATAFGPNNEETIRKMLRCLKEFRIRGVKTNIHFLINVLEHPEFQSGSYNVNFIEEHPELFELKPDRDRGTKLLRYIADVTINGYSGAGAQEVPDFEPIQMPSTLDVSPASGTKQKFDELGPDKFSKWLSEQKQVFFTDTTWRDAHQSLFATRLRTIDMARVAGHAAKGVPNLFSLECWGGATFDVSYRFLHEDPWERLRMFRREVPNTLLQMLLRGANAVGYTSYPDNVVRQFIQRAAANGIDVFRVFDSLNSLDNMHVAIDEVRAQNKIAEVALCYTGDILDGARTKYNLDYYVNMAKELEKAGANIIAIKDMAGLLKPQASYNLVSALKDAVSVPIHLHTHDTSGNGILTLATAIDAGVDVVDVAFSALAGGTSNPSMETLYHGLEGTTRQPELEMENVTTLNRYWGTIRKSYHAFDQVQVSPSPEVYYHEMPGGQYTNLYQQAKSVGLGERFEEVKDRYHRVNQLFGDIIKVTPSSKVVGDMALFCIQNELNEENIYEKGLTLSFPESVIQFFRGDLGQPVGGFNEKLQKVVLKDIEPITVRPGLLAPEVDFEEVRKELETVLGHKPKDQQVLSYLMYPKVYKEYQERKELYGDLSKLDTQTFFYGMRMGETIQMEYAPGKVFMITLVQIGEPDQDGNRIMFYRFNGQSREIIVHDASATMTTVKRQKADANDFGQIGATMPGSVLKVFVTKGEAVRKGQVLLVTEAMKMETTIQAPFDGVVETIAVKEQDMIDVSDLLLTIRKK